MSINKNIDVKGKKHLISSTKKDEDNILDQNKLMNYANKSKEVYKAGKSDYKIEITKAKSKSDKILLNSPKNQKNDKYLENNFLKFEKTSVNIQKVNSNEKNNLKINQLEEENHLMKNIDSKISKNNFEKFKNGNKSNSNKDNNNQMQIQKQSEIQEIKENDEEQILLLCNNKIDNRKLFQDNNFDNNLNLIYNKEDVNFKTIEIDKYSNKIKEIDLQNNKFFDNNPKIDNQKSKNEKSNLREKKSRIENNEQENLSNNGRVLFQEINLIKSKNSNNSEEKTRNSEYTKKKTLFSIDIFKSKGDANVIDQNYKKGKSKKNLRESEKQSLLKYQKSALDESKNIHFSRTNYYGGISPIKIKIKNPQKLENSLIHLEKQVKNSYIPNIENKNEKDIYLLEKHGKEKKFSKKINVKKCGNQTKEKVSSCLEEIYSEDQIEEAKKYFLNSKVRRKEYNSQFTASNQGDIFSEEDKLIDMHHNTNEKATNIFKANHNSFQSENSIFYQNNYFKEDLFKQRKFKKGEDTTANKNTLMVQERLMYYYLNPKIYTAMPKFMKISNREKKCQEIMQYQETQIPERLRQFYDPYPCLKIRKTFFKFFETIKNYLTIIKHPFFDNISLMIIIINTIFILISNPTDQNSIANTTDQYFLYLFSIEMFLKFLAYGIVIPPNSYFRDYWNILDFLVVVFGWISYILENSFGGQKISGLAGLRAFRILRPLKTIKSIKGLRRIIGTLLESMLALGDIVIVLFFFFLIFAIAGLQMWSGLLLRRCFSSIYGFHLGLDDYQNMCSTDNDCKQFNNGGERFYCANTNENPNINVTHFDNLVNSLITVFIIATMEGWTDIYNYVSNTFKDDFKINAIIVFFYFHVLLFVGGYYLINLYLAVINTQYAEIESRNRKSNKKENLSLYSILMETFNTSTADQDQDKDDPNREKEALKVLREELEEEEYANLNEEQKIKKIKSEVNVFEDNLNELPTSYETLNDIYTIKTFTSKELYDLKAKIIKEANNAIGEFKKIYKQRKKSEIKVKETNSNKISSKRLQRQSFLISNRNSQIQLEQHLKERRKTELMRENIFTEFSNSEILNQIIPISIQKTIEKFEEDIEKANLEVEKKNKTKKIIQEKKKQKLQQFLNQNNNLDKERNNVNSSDSDSNSSDKDNKKNKEGKNNKERTNLNKTHEIEKKTTGITDKRTTFEEEKKNEDIYDLSFSINTSDDSSYSYGYIDESIKQENQIKYQNNEFGFNHDSNNKDIENFNEANNIRLENGVDKNIINNKTDEENFSKISRHDEKLNFENVKNNNENLILNKCTSNQLEDLKNIKDVEISKNNNMLVIDNHKSRNINNNILNKRENILIKKTLVDQENVLYNKMIVVKPDNPMIILPKYREENIVKKKKKLWKSLAKTTDMIDENFQELFKKNNKKDNSFLNFLKNTEEAGQRYRPVTVDEIKNYEYELEDQSLNISKLVNDPALLVTEKSEMENLSSLAKHNKSNSLEIENKRIDEFNFLNERLDDYEFQSIMRNTISDKKRDKRNTINSIESNNNNIIKKIRKLDLFTRHKGSIDSFCQLNNIINSNSSRNRDEFNSIPVNNNLFLSKDRFGKFNTNVAVLNNLNGHKALNSRDNLILIKYDNDIISKLDFRQLTENKTSKKRAFSIRKNDVKYACIELTKVFNTKDLNEKVYVSANTINKASYGTNSKEVEKKNLRKSLLENNNTMDTIKGKEKEHYQNYRKYMKYLNFIISRDFKIKDDFSADDFLFDVMGKTENVNCQIKKVMELDPIKIFNKKSENFKTNSYIKYLLTPILEDDLVEIKNNLKHLPINVLSEMDFRTKNFRYLNVKDKSYKNQLNRVITVNGNLNSKISTKKNVDRFYPARSEISDVSTMHKSFSIISNSSSGFVRKNILKEIQINKEKNMLRAFEDYLSLTTELKIKQFFDKDKYQKITDNDKNNNIARIKIEVDLNKEDIKNKIEKIRTYDIETNMQKYKEWSGHQVMNWQEDCKRYYEWNHLISQMEQVHIVLWGNNSILELILKRIRYFFFKLSTNPYFEFFILFIVIFNIMTMLLSGNLLTIEEQNIIKNLNLTFNVIFIFEFVCKFIGLGPIIYFSDAFTWLDLLIIGLAILDLTNLNVDDIEITNQNNKKLASQFAFFKIFRIFRVLRIAKILRRIKSFRKILVGIKESLSNVAYNSLILLIFLIIFQLLGMSFLYQDENYQSFFASFYITYQMLTIENWNTVLYNLSSFNRLSVLYLVALIFIGNYILFNLFISILLNSFDSMADITEEESEIFEKLPEEFFKYAIMENKIKNPNKSKSENKSSNVVDIKEENSKDDSSEEENLIEDSKNVKSSFSQIFGIRKFLKKRSAINNIFKNNECEYSLYLFGQTSKIRLFCKNMVSWRKFETFILIMILLSTLRLIIDTFVDGARVSIIFDMVDIFFTFVFLIEMIFKIIALGFIFNEGTYLKDNWNRIDFVIVFVSLIDLQNLISKYTGNISSSSLNFLKVLRLLRTLRPLRFISHNVQLKIIITALLDSIGPIANVLIIVFIILLIFSIVGMMLFYELYHTCYRPNEYPPFLPILNFTDYLDFKNPDDYNNFEKISAKCNSLGGTYDATPSFKFSNIFTSLITSYVLANGEGWSDIMNSYRSYNELYGLFFVGFSLIVTNFFFNLFVGVMFSSFNEAWTKEHKKEITENSSVEQYWDFLKQIEIAVPEWSTFKTPDRGIRKIIYDLTQSKFFDNFIIMVILMNMMTMAVDFYGSSPSFTDNLDTLNLIFTVIFILECVLKNIANGFSGYFYYGWNKFDFFVVSSSLLDLVMKYTNQSKVNFLKSFQIIRVLRVLRVTRVLRLIKSLRGLEKLLQTLRWSINALMNVFILMFLIFCIFAIIGCYLFSGLTFTGNEKKFAIYNQYFNFDNFYNSFLLCFRSVTGENWPLMMIEVSIVGSNDTAPYTAYLYFIIMNFITYIIMLNLFLLVTLQQYEDFSRKENNPIERFSELLDNFKLAWNKYSTESDNGYRIKNENMTNFLMDLEGEIMKKKKKRIDLLKKYIMDLGLLNDEQNYVYFQDVLFKIIKHEFGQNIDKKKNKLIIKEEEKLIKSIKTKIDNYIKTTKSSREKIYSNPLNTFNPLTSHLYYKNSFKYMKYFLKCYMETAEEKRENILKIGFDAEDIKFIANHKKNYSKIEANISGKLIGDKLEILDNLKDNFNAYLKESNFIKKGSRNSVKALTDLLSADSDNRNYEIIGKGGENY